MVIQYFVRTEEQIIVYGKDVDGVDYDENFFGASFLL